MRLRLASAFLLALATPGAGADPGPIAVASPDGRIRAEVFVEKEGEASRARYRVSFRGRPIIRPSGLSIELGGADGVGWDATVEGSRERSVRQTYTQVVGKRSRVLDHYNEAVVSFREKDAPARRGLRWDLVVRVYDDGVAFRYEFPKQEGRADLAIADEHTAFRFPDGAIAHALPLASYTTSHEARYVTKPVADLPAGLYGLPMLVELPGAGWAAVAEANLTDHAGLYLRRVEDTKDQSLKATLSPLPIRPADAPPGRPQTKAPRVAVHAEFPHRTPWRAILIGDSPGALVESDLILNLNEPCAIADPSWIRTGKTTFPWWNGFYEKPGAVPFMMGLNTETAKYYIDFCAESGIPYHSLDGLDNIAWYGGTIVPYAGNDITRGIDGLDLQEVLRHAKSKGVKIRLWMHWQAAETHMDRAFPLYREWGVEGVMLDFMDRDDQEMVKFLRRAIAKAAENRLTITLHGVSAPTGLERTYPNLLNHEGVMNLEYDKWDPAGIPPEHEVTVPYTRMLAGPMDFHLGSLRGVPVSQFKPRNEAPLVMGSPCRMLASYVVFQNGLPMAADYPSAYRGNPALPLLVAIPTNWDDTRFLAGKVGESIAIARRSGEEWWIGAMTDRQAREIELPLKFLGEGRYQSEIHIDDPIATKGWRTRRQDVGSGDVLRLSLPPAGGALVRIRRAGDR